MVAIMVSSNIVGNFEGEDSNNLNVWLKLRSSTVSWNLECEKRVFKRAMFLLIKKKREKCFC